MSNAPLTSRSTETNAMWRSLEELERSESVTDWIQHEFPQGAELWGADPSNRREFLKLMAASLALAGINGCGHAPQEKIVPTVELPDHAPGQTLQYATAMPMSGGALGLLVTSRDGRPLKIEGNPLHPASLGATDVYAQAATLELYDPDRSRVVRNRQQISSWSDFLTEFTARVRDHGARAGQGLRILSSPVLSPTMEWQMRQLQEKWPNVHWHHYEPIHDDNERAGAMLAFGQDVRSRFHLDEADVIISLDADLFGTGPGKLRYARDFMDRRRDDLGMGSASTNRLYCIESTPSTTGAAGDHRWPLAPQDILRFVRGMAQKLGFATEGPAVDSIGGLPVHVWDAVVADVKAAGPRALFVAGCSQPAEVHAIVHVLNHHLGTVGRTISYTQPAARTSGDQRQSMKTLVDAMQSGEVQTLLVLGANPIYDAPVDAAFKSAIQKVSWSAHLGTYADETAAASTWHVPEAHFLESWGDARAFDGTVSLIQPLIAPLHEGRSTHDLLNVLLGTPRRSAYETVRTYWRDVWGETDFERVWQQSLHDGVIRDSASAAVETSLRAGVLSEAMETLRAAASAPTLGTFQTALFRPHPTLWDGRFANNGWLQELPQPFSTLTWSNAALVAPVDAKSHELQSGDVIEVCSDNRSLRVPIWILPGQASGVITLQMGGGRTHSGRLGSNLGCDVFALRTADQSWLVSNLRIQKTGEKQRLPATQQHFLMEDRDLVRAGSWRQFHDSPKHPGFMGEKNGSEEAFSFYPPSPNGTADQQWGMSINLGACIGCNACVIACQAENNIPIVGSKQVSLGREMHWLRVATYFTGSVDAPQTYHQPIPCMHCEHAPCEVVCPVAATTHSNEGLNEMTYNRCVGTRYCSNNCPYKVRRFNFLDYHEELRQEPLLQLLPNPEVTVRSRGVMEKCTYCVQRISAARIQAGLQDRPIRDGEVVTACQSVCPTRAIRFGNISDPDTEVSIEKKSPLAYSLLAELNTRPRTTYLAALRNPHPDLVEG